ncbi:dihydrodipicolinate synthase family protein [Rhizomonospora bruguierae]|uniref:dihydrodipicolinate synthase family protein n=1 Tax=Rhizomonospora bruguierae TaxID=1581705 RepID=UPI001BCEB61E|nr:dihydrodipicolinate synthase family protein [Micromonospora sp. NBRC 107566]
MGTIGLQGVVTAVVTPFHQDESLDLDALRKYIEHVLSVDGVTGLLCCGYTGEVTSLNRDEQLRVVRTVAEATDKRVPIIAGLQPTSTVDTIAFGRELKAAGADVLQVNSPFYNVLRRGYLANEDNVVKFFRDLADGIDLPMTVFQYPTASGVCYPPSTIARLAEIEHVVGIKEATSMETYAADYDAVAGRTAVFADNNTYTLIGMLLYGSAGTMVGVGNVGTHLWTRLYQLIESGDTAAGVRHANEKLVPLMNTFTRDLGQTPWSFVARVKEALFQMGLLPNPTVRAPEPPVTEADRTEIRETLRRVGLLD